MSERLINLLMRLAPRERVLLGLLFFVVLPLALWLVWLAPLSTQRAAAVQQLQDARALNAWVDGRVVDHSRLGQDGQSGPRPPIGSAGVEQSLIAAGLRDQVTELINRSEGGIEVRFDAIVFEDLVSWLALSDPGWGYDIGAFRIERSDMPGIVFASLTLQPQG